MKGEPYLRGLLQIKINDLEMYLGMVIPSAKQVERLKSIADDADRKFLEHKAMRTTA